MAEIVLGIGISHSPQLSTPTEVWERHAERDRSQSALLGTDGEFHTYDELLARAEPGLADALTPRIWEEQYARSQAGIERIADELAAAQADVVVVFGDDQHELFLDDGIPAFALSLSDSLWDYPPSPEQLASLPSGLAEASWAQHSPQPDQYRGHPELNGHVARCLTDAGFDLCVLRKQPEGRSLGHAYTFVRRRLGLTSETIVMPVFLNTYFMPNVPSVERCYDFGRHLARAVEEWPEPLRVAVVASGGLSHFVVDEALDRGVLEALRHDDLPLLQDITKGKMRSGTSEVLNWVAAAGALKGRPMEVLDYIPAYRTPAGTGIGMGFCLWRQGVLRK
ncbi:hypothetical protein ACIOEX_31670 [Streptomyces sp. NPDC087850]|uniref:DODA-type extradiol aromatic ring-opening family dioxygenase n=1 Tax=Streptomyces sp. NPDC087850 TaxID=3365809 RepID=UPI003822C6FD